MVRSKVLFATLLISCLVVGCGESEQEPAFGSTDSRRIEGSEAGRDGANEYSATAPSTERSVAGGEADVSVLQSDSRELVGKKVLDWAGQPVGKIAEVVHTGNAERTVVVDLEAAEAMTEEQKAPIPLDQLSWNEDRTALKSELSDVQLSARALRYAEDMSQRRAEEEIEEAE